MFSFLLFVVSTLVQLLHSCDTETQRLALQTIELLAIENAEIVIEKVVVMRAGS